jgi:formate-dependent nitrite reductase membrane component NrfD
MPSADALRQRLTDLNLTYRPQREWAEGRGLLVVVAHFFSGVGAGAWLFSVALDYDGGLVISTAIMGLAGVAHLAFLGRWQRFWRIALRPQSSWISRGLWGLAIFLAGAIPYALPPVRDSGFGPVVLGVSLAGMAIVLAYKGFVYAASRAIPFWHLPLLPVLYIAYGLRGGAAVLLVAGAVASARGGFDIDLLEVIKLWVVVSSAVLVLLYLALAINAGGAARRSVGELIAGRISPAFYAGTIFCGLVIPIALGATGATTGASRGLLALIGLSSLVGDFYIKYCIVKAGIYLSVVEELPAPRRYGTRRAAAGL